MAFQLQSEEEFALQAVGRRDLSWSFEPLAEEPAKTDSGKIFKQKLDASAIQLLHEAETPAEGGKLLASDWLPDELQSLTFHDVFNQKLDCIVLHQAFEIWPWESAIEGKKLTQPLSADSWREKSKTTTTWMHKNRRK